MVSARLLLLRLAPLALAAAWLALGCAHAGADAAAPGGEEDGVPVYAGRAAGDRGARREGPAQTMAAPARGVEPMLGVHP